MFGKRAFGTTPFGAVAPAVADDNFVVVLTMSGVASFEIAADDPVATLLAERKIDTAFSVKIHPWVLSDRT